MASAALDGGGWVHTHTWAACVGQAGVGGSRGILWRSSQAGEGEGEDEARGITSGEMR